MWPKYLKFLPFYLLSLLPLSVLHLFSYILFILVYHLIGYRKKVVHQNISRSFPTLDQLELKQIQKNFYKHFTQLFLESLKVLTISKGSALKRVKIQGTEKLSEWYAKNTNVILYGAHMGNWEWFAFFPLHIEHQFVSFYQEQSNSYFNELSILMRERFGNICVESRTAYKKLIEMNKSGTKTLAYLLADQSPMAKSSMIWTNFLNQRTAFLVGADRIAKKAGHKIVYPFVKKIKPGFYEVELIEIPTDQDSQSLVDNYAKLLEENIKAQPEIWLWSHRRWKIEEPISS